MTSPYVSTDPELGTVRLCVGCRIWWPEDSEFYYFQGRHSVTRCRACYAERVRGADGVRRFVTAKAGAVA